MSWISVKDGLPKELEEVLTFGEAGVCTAAIYWFDDDGKPYFMCKGEFRVEPTHWMPFPKGPDAV